MFGKSANNKVKFQDEQLDDYVLEVGAYFYYSFTTTHLTFTHNANQNS